MKRRLDQALVDRGLAPSRTRAREMIEAGQIRVGEKAVTKASFEISDDETIQAQAGEADRYVSRGGLKLERALRAAGLSVRGLKVLDVGQSTGGFTDCLLQDGAEKVVGVDVGHGQLHASLAKDARVVAIEGLHAREKDQLAKVLPHFGAMGPDLAVADVSFISLTAILPALAHVVATGKPILALVKPQFEVGPEGLGKGGIVRDPLLYSDVERKIKRSAEEAGFRVQGYFESALEGKDGNKEFFLHAVKI